MKPARRTIGGHDIKIEGKRYNIHFARIVFRCAQCYGPLAKVDFGLKCQADPDHRFYIHRDRVAEIEKRQQANVESLNEFYQIKDGKVVLKCQFTD